MTKESTANVAAETDAVLDQPKDEMKPVTSDVPKAKDDAIVFANRVKMYATDDGGFKTSDVEVYNTDNLSAGGSLDNVSMDASRNAGSGTVHGAGYNPVDKLDRIEADNYDNVAPVQMAMSLEGAPDKMEDDVSTNLKPGLTHKLKSMSPGKQNEFGQLYNRNAVATSAEKIIFVRGQMDAASPSKGYPTRGLLYTPPTEGAAGSFNEGACTIQQGNYLLKGMNFVVQNGQLTDVNFDVVNIDVESDPYILDTRVDHGKLLDNIAEHKVQEWAKMINAKGTDFYSPVASGVTQPARCARLLNDIAITDGAIVYAAVKSMCEAYAYGQVMRTKMGGSRGSMRLGALMTRLDNVETGHERASNMALWTSHGRVERNSIPEAFGIDTFMALFQTQRSWNGYFGNMIQQPTFQQFYRDALKYVDSMGWKIDKDTLSVFDKTYGWFKDSEADQIVGINRYGIVAPYNPNEYFNYVELLDGSYQLDGACHIMNSVTIGDGVVSTIGSNLFYGMVRYFQEILLPKLRAVAGGNCSTTINVPFDFATDRFTFGQMFIAEAMDKISRDGGDKYINGAYRQFQDSFGVDPFDDDVTTGFGVSNILNTAAFRGLGTAPVLAEAHDALKLMLSDPEFIALDAAWNGEGATNLGKLDALVQVHPGVGRVHADAQYEKEFLFPEVVKMGMILPGLRRVLQTGAKSYFRTRDLPLYPYDMHAVQGAGSITLSKFADVTERSEDHVAGLWRAGNFESVHMEAFSLTAGGPIVAMYASDIVSVPRYNGRIAPAPLNCLDRGNGLGGNVLNINAGSTGSTVAIDVLPIETYNIVYLFDSDFESKMYGTATYRDVLVVNTASLVDNVDHNGALNTLASAEGVYIDVPPFHQIADNQLVTSGLVTAQYHPGIATLLDTVISNYPYFETPLSGVGAAAVSSGNKEYHDDRFMLQANEAFGLKFFARTYWTRYAEKMRAVVFDKSNDMVDNQLERMDNMLL